MKRALPILALMLISTGLGRGAFAYTDELVLEVGVLSPLTGSSSVAGGGHAESVELAHSRLGSILKTGDQLVRIELIEVDYESDPTCAAFHANRLRDDTQLVALLGPINSGAVRSVLTRFRDTEVGERLAPPPLLSALATAPDLAQPNDAFFRLSFDDVSRMKQYARVIAPQTESLKRHFVAQQTAYGDGLLDGLTRHLDGRVVRWLPEETAQPGPDGAALDADGAPTACKSQIPTEQDSADGAAEAARRRRQARDAERRRLSEADTRTLASADAVVILGTTSGSLEIAQELARRETNAALYLVGSNHAVFTMAPPDAHTIGDPALDPYRAQSDRERIEWTRILQQFQDRQRMSIDDFMPTAYEAYSVLRQALEIVLREGRCAREPGNIDVACIRKDLTAVLARGRFDSLDAWRSISFDDKGNLATPPLAPVYRIERSAARVGSNPEHGWVEVEVAERSGALLGPVEITLRPFGPMRGRKTRLYLIDDRNGAAVSGGQHTKKIIDDFSVVLDSDEVTVERNFMPGEYRIVLSRDSNPASARFAVEWTRDYPIAWLTALIAVGLVAYREAREKGTDAVGPGKLFARAAGGVASATLLLFVLAFGLQWVPTELSGIAALSVPQSVLAGLVGGVGGPGLLGGLLQGTVDRWLGRSTNGAGAGSPGGRDHEPDGTG